MDAGCRSPGQGVVGSCVYEDLLSFGAKVHGTKTNTPSHNEVDGARFVTADLGDRQAAKETLEESNPHLTYHLAALVDTSQSVDLDAPRSTRQPGRCPAPAEGVALWTTPTHCSNGFFRNSHRMGKLQIHHTMLQSWT